MYFDNDVYKIIKNYYDDIIDYRESYKIIKYYFTHSFENTTYEECNINFERFKNILFEYKFNRYNLIIVNYDDSRVILLNINFKFLFKYSIYKIEKKTNDNVILYLK